MAKKKKLTKEELHRENEKIRNEINEREAGEHSDSERIVNALRGKNIAAYALILLLPIVGIWWLWHKKEDLKLNNPSMLLWTGVGIVVLVEQIVLVYNYFAV